MLGPKLILNGVVQSWKVSIHLFLGVSCTKDEPKRCALARAFIQTQDSFPSEAVLKVFVIGDTFSLQLLGNAAFVFSVVIIF